MSGISRTHAANYSNIRLRWRNFESLLKGAGFLPKLRRKQRGYAKFLCRLGKNDVDMQAGWFLVEVCLSLYRAVSVDEGYEGIQHF